MRKGVIYKITSPSGKVYIGQTINLPVRINLYRKGRCKSQRKLYESLKAHGFDQHHFEVIEENLDEPLLAVMESAYIKFLDCVGRGLNCTHQAGAFFRNRSHSDETKQKMSISRVEKKRGPFSPEHRQKLSESAQRRTSPHPRLGVTLSIETREKIAAKRRKIIPDQLPVIRLALLSGRTMKEVAIQFNTNTATICDIKNYRRAYKIQISLR